MKLSLMLITLTLLVSCGKGPAGKDGINGLNGQDGIQGEQGEAGKDGKDGLNGTSVSMVKFCPGLVDVYNQAYSERGLCIDGKIYAVYSSNSLAALVELSQGLYQTTTPQGTNCQFKVLANCEVIKLD